MHSKTKEAWVWISEALDTSKILWHQRALKISSSASQVKQVTCHLRWMWLKLQKDLPKSLESWVKEKLRSEHLVTKVAWATWRAIKAISVMLWAVGQSNTIVSQEALAQDNPLLSCQRFKRIALPTSSTQILTSFRSISYHRSRWRDSQFNFHKSTLGPQFHPQLTQSQHLQRFSSMKKFLPLVPPHK